VEYWGFTNMSKTTKILLAIGFAALIGFIMFSTTGLAKVSCEVCMEYNGQRSCAKAFGIDRNEATRTATDVACTDIAFGRDQSIACTQLTRPVSTTCE
jgi:hypothetical protein